MKHLAALLIAIALLRPAAHAQDSPPAPLSDLTWSWVERLVDGQPIVVTPTAGPSVHCRFAGATDAYLFCDPDNARYAASGYRFDRAQVVNVKISRPKANWHPALLAVSAAVGIAIGAAASSRGASDKAAAAGALVTALLVGAIGYQAEMMQQDRGFILPLPPLHFSAPHAHGIVHWSPR